MKLTRVSNELNQQLSKLKNRLGPQDESRGFIDKLPVAVSNLEDEIEGIFGGARQKIDSIAADRSLTGEGQLNRRADMLQETKTQVESKINAMGKRLNDRFESLKGQRTLRMFQPEDKSAGFLQTESIRNNLKNKFDGQPEVVRKRAVKEAYEQAMLNGNLAAIAAIEESNNYFSDLLPQSEIEGLIQKRLEVENPAITVAMGSIETAINGLSKLVHRIDAEFIKNGINQRTEDGDILRDRTAPKGKSFKNPKGKI